MVSRGATVIAAVSGGADSMALLASLACLRPVYDLTIVVAHINHQLRGAESQRDADFVEEQARQRGCAYYHTHVDVKAMQRQAPGSLQQAARRLRYRFLRALAHTIGATHVALGHTADDQAETLVMRFLCGSGPTGLAGIPPVRAPFIRPLITISRRVILNYLLTEQIPWVEDSSNTHRAYLRNRIRLDLLPVLRHYNPRLGQRLSTLAEMLQADDAALQQQTDRWIARLLTWTGLKRASIPCAPFCQESVAIQRRILRRVVERCSHQARAVHLQHIERLRHLLHSGSLGQRLSLPGQCMAERHQTRVLLWNTQDAAMPTAGQPLWIPGAVDVPALQVRIRADFVEKPMRFDPQNPQSVCVDPQRLTSPLQVRAWQPGDRFYPLGAPGHQKLHDFFITQKVPRAERPYIPLVVSGTEIVWVVGQRLAEPFKIRPDTQRVVCLQAQRSSLPMPPPYGE